MILTRLPWPALMLSAALPLLGVSAARADTPEQRGFFVYQHVCSACHGMEHVAFGDMKALGIPTASLKDWAAQRAIPDGLDENGAPRTRKATLADHILSPWPTPEMARKANGGDIPPDMSRLALVLPGHGAYIRKLLLSYAPPPPGVVMKPGHYYNTATKHLHIEMPPPLHDDMLAYPDGTRATTEQMAGDVASFLEWVAHPHQAERRPVGWAVLAYLAIMTGLAYLLRRRLWKGKTKP